MKVGKDETRVDFIDRQFYVFSFILKIFFSFFFSGSCMRSFTKQILSESLHSMIFSSSLSRRQEEFCSGFLIEDNNSKSTNLFPNTNRSRNREYDEVEYQF